VSKAIRLEDVDGQLMLDRLLAKVGPPVSEEHGEKITRRFRCPVPKHNNAEMPLVLVHYAALARTWDVACSERCQFDDVAAALGIGSTEPPAGKSAATVLVEIAEELYRFGVSDTGESFAVPRSGPQVVRLLRGGKNSLRAQLASEFWTRFRRTAPQQTLTDALGTIEGLAQDGEEQPLALRVARRDGALWLDLGDAAGRAVRIMPGGWSVEPAAPVLFRRTTLTAALPEPVRGASLEDLWSWLNVADEDRPLVAAWLIAVLFPDVPHTAMFLTGEQGAGKSTAERALVLLLDPSVAPLRKPPRDAESWVTAAAGSWVVGLDNLSTIPDWLSDSLCRAVTGDADVRRKLYTDGEHAVFAFRRCLVINGIDVGTIRGDLAERMLTINLHLISDEDRRGEEDLWPAWEREHPRLLGAVLDLAAQVLAVLPTVQLERRPRMADFARVLAAVDRVLGTEGLDRYLAKQGEAAADTLTGDLFLTAVAARFGGAEFEGTATNLLDDLTPFDNMRTPKGWPATARQVTAILRRQAPTMRKAGWLVQDDEAANHDKVIRWTIKPPMAASAGTCRECGHRLDPAITDGVHPECAGVAGQIPLPAGLAAGLDAGLVPSPAGQARR
jgi:hypothetical protein